jgi:nucleotide-binding universal stress UspA family protein
MLSTRSMGRYAHLLVATDFSTSSLEAVRAGAALAARLGAQITLAHVHDTPFADEGPETSPQLSRDMARAARGRLEELRDRELSGLPVEIVAYRHANAAVGVAELAIERGADGCIVGTHGRTGLGWIVLGSVAELVVRYAPCDVLVVRAGARDSFRAPNVLVGVDLKPEAEREPLDAAAFCARNFDARITVAHVWHGPRNDDDGASNERRRTLHDACGDAIASLRDPAFAALQAPKPAAALCELAARLASQWIVVGAHGHSTAERVFLGSVAERVVRGAPCNVLVARRPRRASRR